MLLAPMTDPNCFLICYRPQLEDKTRKNKVMDNPITKSIPELLNAAAEVKGAAENEALDVSLVVNTAANIGADTDALTTTRNNHEQGKVVLADCRAVLLSVIMTVRLFLTLGRDMMKPIFGAVYSEAFDILGFTNDSIGVPFTAEELLPMLQAYKAFYLTNPSRENAPIGITAAQAQLLYDQLNAAKNAVNAQKGIVQNLKDQRDEAASQLRKRLRDVIKELEMQLDPFDGRWLSFGFNIPGLQATPDAPSNLSAILIGPNAVALKWDAAARAEYYRVFKKLHGTDDDYVAVGSPADLDFSIENLPAHSTIEIVVTALNNGGESAYSEKTMITTQ